MRKSALSDTLLNLAVAEMEKGFVDVDLGGGIVKKRIGLASKGKRRGVRTIVATNFGNRWFFLYGFEKNDRSNISKHELRLF